MQWEAFKGGERERKMGRKPGAFPTEPFIRPSFSREEKEEKGEGVVRGLVGRADKKPAQIICVPPSSFSEENHFQGQCKSFVSPVLASTFFCPPATQKGDILTDFLRSSFSSVAGAN